jgi:ABC-type nitrate/sulfonate/bicarbonate transport system substrate-binding protein
MRIKSLALRTACGLTVAFVPTVLAASSGTAATTIPRQSAALTTIQIAVPPSTLQAVPLVWAQQAGIMARHGVDLEFTYVTGAAAILSALLSGSADVTVEAVNPVWPVLKQGQKVQALFPTVSSYVDVIAQPSMPFNSAPRGEDKALPNVRALKGKTIGVAALGLSGPTVLLERLLRLAGVSDQDVTLVAVGNGATAVAAFLNHKIDAMITTPPEEELIGSDNFKYVANLANVPFYAGLLNGVATIMKPWAQAHATTVARLCSAVSDAYTEILKPKNESQVIAFMQQDLNLPTTSVARQVWQHWKYTLIGNKPITKKLWASGAVWNVGGPLEGYAPDYSESVNQTCALYHRPLARALSAKQHGRSLNITLAVNRPATAVLRLLKGKKALRTTHTKLKSGTSKLSLRLPRNATAGRYSLRATFTDVAGNTATKAARVKITTK